MAGELAHVRTVLFGFDDTLVDSYPGRMAAMGSAFTAGNSGVWLDFDEPKPSMRKRTCQPSLG
jgi:FMN phosphatase YigB (HAD superfamily)